MSVWSTYYVVSAGGVYCAGPFETGTVAPNHSSLPVAAQPTWSVVQQVFTGDAASSTLSMAEKIEATGLTLAAAVELLRRLRANVLRVETSQTETPWSLLSRLCPTCHQFHVGVVCPDYGTH